jgi:hypothetical protein
LGLLRLASSHFLFVESQNSLFGSFYFFLNLPRFRKCCGMENFREVMGRAEKKNDEQKMSISHKNEKTKKVAETQDLPTV